MAAQLARWAGATVISTVMRKTDLDQVAPAPTNSVALDQATPVDAIRALCPQRELGPDAGSLILSQEPENCCPLSSAKARADTKAGL